MVEDGCEVVHLIYIMRVPFTLLVALIKQNGFLQNLRLLFGLNRGDVNIGDLFLAQKGLAFLGEIFSSIHLDGRTLKIKYLASK